MKIILLANHIYAIPTINHLASKQLLQAVVMPDAVQPFNQQVEIAANANNIPYKRFAKSELKTSFKDWIIQEAPDMVLAYTFLYRIPEVLFSIPKYGFFNVHYSLLPAYMGPFPVFWQMKNGEHETAGITIHQMDEDFDTGPIFSQQVIPILPGETQGLYSAKLSSLSVNLIADFIDKVSTNKVLKLSPSFKKSYYPRPQLNDFTINWNTHNASEIENLVNACNAEIGGGITSFKGQMIRILEVAKANVNSVNSPAFGTVVYSDVANGVYVACKDNEYLRVNIVQMPEGIFSGNKIASMGIKAGDFFD